MHDYLPLGNFIIFDKDIPADKSASGLFLVYAKEDLDKSVSPPYTGNILFPGSEQYIRGAIDSLSGYAVLKNIDKQILIAVDKENVLFIFEGEDIKMMNRYILIEDIEDQEKKSESGLWLPTDKYQRIAKVISVSEDEKELKPGDLIVKPIGLTTPVEIFGKQYDCIHKKRIFAKLNKQ